MPVLDGLRGIAVILVLMFHLMPDVAMPSRAEEWIKKAFTTGGWVGVDLFFVLSGFLITGILINAKASPRFFRTFYARRALRIFPLYFGTLAVVFLLLPALGILGGQSFETIQATQHYSWLFVTNVGVWLHGSNAFISDYVTVGPFWTLAVEEHFYLMWPLVVYLVDLRTLRRICVCLFLSALALRCAWVVLEGNRSLFYYLTPCRWDALAAGAFLATLHRERSVNELMKLVPPAWVVVGVGTAFLATYFVLWKGLWVGSWVMSSLGLSVVAATFAACAFLLIQQSPDSLGARAVGSGFLCFFGQYSYGLYVIHSLMVPTLRGGHDAWMSHFQAAPLLGATVYAILASAACVPLAMLSWHLYEKQFLKLKHRFDYSRRTTDAPIAASGNVHA